MSSNASRLTVLDNSALARPRSGRWDPRPSLLRIEVLNRLRFQRAELSLSLGPSRTDASRCGTPPAPDESAGPGASASWPGGENVYPIEVENVLISCSDVADVGVPSEKWARL
jgi:hypothetical protein